MSCLQKASTHIFAPHLAEGQGLETGYTFPFSTNEHGIIASVSLDAVTTSVSPPLNTTVLSRLLLSTTTGSVQLWHQDSLQWSREEGLADVRVAEMVELPEKVVVEATEGGHVRVGEEAFWERIRRQAREAQVSISRP